MYPLNLFRKSTHVQPLQPDNDQTSWLVTTHRPIAGLLLDTYLYGMRVAISNFIVMLTSKPKPVVREDSFQ